MARLTSAFFVAQLIRRVNGGGGFAAVLKKGAEEAGAIHIVVRPRTGELAFYGPAMQADYDAETTGERRFQRNPAIADDRAVSAFAEKERRFDTDFWLVELDGLDAAAALPFDITTP